MNQHAHEAEGFRTTSAFAAGASSVRGLERLHPSALRLKYPPSALYALSTACRDLSLTFGMR